MQSGEGAEQRGTFLLPQFCRIYVFAIGSELLGKNDSLSSATGSRRLHLFVVNLKPMFLKTAMLILIL